MIRRKENFWLTLVGVIFCLVFLGGCALAGRATAAANSLIQLSPKVLSAVQVIASGSPNPTYYPNPTIQVVCFMPAEDRDADGMAIQIDAERSIYKINLTYEVCARLNTFAHSPRLKGDDFSDSAVLMSWDLRVATHEAKHVFLWRNSNYPLYTEPQTDCLAVQDVARFAQLLGASKKTAKRVYRLNTEIALFNDYASPCGQGHPYKPPKIVPRGVNEAQ